jgi:glycosyltransferase involved in cell wall biosynthesis
LRRHTYRCVHAVEEAAYLMWLPCRLSRVPLVYDMQSSIPDQVRALQVWRTRPVQRLLRWVEGWLVRRAGLRQRVQAQGRAAPHREWHFPARSRLAHAKPDACEPAGRRELMRRQLELSASAQVVVYSGNFEPYQGMPLLLAALPLVVRAAPHTLLVLVGAADQRQIEATNAAVAPGLRRHLRIVARQPRDQVERFLLAAEVLVSPRVSGDNAPLKIFDYLGAARPIVGTEVTAHRAVLRDDEALLVEPTPEALAQGILRLLQDDQLARRMAGASAARREWLGWPAFSRRGRPDLWLAGKPLAVSVPDPRSVAVVIPARNEGRTIRQLVEAVVAQRPPALDLEVIVVDNASVDNTAARAREAGARVLPLPLRGGRGNPAAACNLARAPARRTS